MKKSLAVVRGRHTIVVCSKLDDFAHLLYRFFFSCDHPLIDNVSQSLDIFGGLWHCVHHHVPLEKFILVGHAFCKLSGKDLHF